MAKKIIIFVILFLTLFFVFKDYLLKVCIEHYIERELGGDCSIEEVHVSFSGIKIRDLHFNSNDINFKLKSGSAKFAFDEILMPYISRIAIEEALFSVEESHDVKEKFKNKKIRQGDNLWPALAYKRMSSSAIDLRDITINLRDPYRRDLRIVFSFKGSFRGGNLDKVEHIAIEDFNVRGERFNIKNTHLKRLQNDAYILNVPELEINGRTLKNLIIPLKMRKSKIIFERARQEILGPKAFIEGVLEFEDLRNICLYINIDNICFTDLARLISDNKSMIFEGLFGGKIHFCFLGTKITTLECSFYNGKGGSIHIKETESFDFLKRNLGEATHAALVNNLKNYMYDEGTVAMRKVNSDLTVTLNLDSQEMGERNITINFHNILGGVK